MDNEVRVDRSGEVAFSAYRVKILKPEALTAGNVAFAWAPSSGEATVHYLRVIRDDQVTDVLAGTKFRVLQREGGLEQSVLDGQLTATLQIPGLQVGDEIEFGASLTRREAAFGTHVSGIAQLPVMGTPGAFRFRILWPQDKELAWRATADLPKVARKRSNGTNVVEYELRDPTGSIPTLGAPPRFNIRRLIEYSDFGTWNNVSRQFWPLFEIAAKLSPSSPLHAQAARIAALSPDPILRAQAALRLVQDQVRYVYVGLDRGNYTPTGADETWKRRFGDCKAKTVLLLALLRELGIQAEPVLVNSEGGDGVDERLPSPRLFNHVLVRAHIGGKSYWLDGTRLGDRYLENLPEPAFRWGLPLSANGAALERVIPIVPRLPQFVGVVDIDARAGVKKAAKVKAQNIIRGDEAFAIRTKLTAVLPADAEALIKQYWRQEANWIEAQRVAWSYDEWHAALVLKVEGDGKLDWTGNDADGHRWTIFGAGFFPPDAKHRPAEQNQAASWSIEFPRFRCWATSIRLPAAGAHRRWSYEADPINRELGGVSYWRTSGLHDNVMRTVMSRRSLTTEISAREATLMNALIPSFNNNMSSVFDTSKVTVDAKSGSSVPPFTDSTDWLTNPSLCSGPAN